VYGGVKMEEICAEGEEIRLPFPLMCCLTFALIRAFGFFILAIKPGGNVGIEWVASGG
jgi:hypothetical protein